MYFNNDIDTKYSNEMLLINFNKKYTFNLNIVKNFKGIYNDLIFLLKNNNDFNLIKKYKYINEIYLLFYCYDIFFYYIVKKNIQLCMNGFIINNKFQDIQLIDFIIGPYKHFIKIIKLLILYRYIKIIKYHLRYVNLEFISINVIDMNTYKIIKFLLNKKIIKIKKEDIENFNYFKQNNKNYYFKKIIKYIKIDIKNHIKTCIKNKNILITKKALKNKKNFDMISIIKNNSYILNLYNENNYFKNIKFL
jgi:hypothetical protein